MTRREHCHLLIKYTVQSITQMATPLSEAQTKQLVQSRFDRDAEQAVDDACLAGNAKATKRACRQWWQAWQQAVQSKGVKL